MLARVERQRPARCLSLFRIDAVLELQLWGLVPEPMHTSDEVGGFLVSDSLPQIQE